MSDYPCNACESNARGTETTYAHTCGATTDDDNMRWISEDMLKEAYSLATKNGYALAIKHFEERIQNGEEALVAVHRMKTLHKTALNQVIDIVKGTQRN